jgi:hypothetical protein
MTAAQYFSIAVLICDFVAVTAVVILTPRPPRFVNLAPYLVGLVLFNLIAVLFVLVFDPQSFLNAVQSMPTGPAA